MIRAIKFTNLVLVFAVIGMTANADSIYKRDNYKSYAADHRASRLGDAVTILIYERSSAASNSDSQGEKSLGGGFDFNSTNRTEFGNFGLDVNNANEQGTQREGNLRAQITAVVESVDEVSGRLQVVGSQEINVNGDKQLIKIRGWVRNIDISTANTVLSTRLSDASIEYRGDDLDSLNGKGGMLRRVGDIIMWAPSKALDLTTWLLGVL